MFRRHSLCQWNLVDAVPDKYRLESEPGWLEITGTKGTYIFDYETWKLIIPKENGQKRIKTGQNPPDAWLKFYHNVADHLTTGAKCVIDDKWARRAVHIF